MILKGKITKLIQGGKYAVVSSLGGIVYPKVLMIYPYGFNSNMVINETSLCLILISGTNIFGIPYNVPLQNELQTGEVELGNDGTGKILLKPDGTIEITGNATSTANLDLAGVLKIDGVQVVSNQGASVSNPTGGVTIDTEARTAINALIDRLRTHGLIA